MQRDECCLPARGAARGPRRRVRVGRRAKDGVGALEREERLGHVRLAERDAALCTVNPDQLIWSVTTQGRRRRTPANWQGAARPRTHRPLILRKSGWVIAVSAVSAWGCCQSYGEHPREVSTPSMLYVSAVSKIKSSLLTFETGRKAPELADRLNAARQLCVLGTGSLEALTEKDCCQ